MGDWSVVDNQSEWQIAEQGTPQATQVPEQDISLGSIIQKSKTPQLLPTNYFLPSNKDEIKDLIKLGYKYSNPIPQSLLNETRDILGIPRPPSEVEQQQLNPTTEYGKRMETGLGLTALGTVLYGGTKAGMNLLDKIQSYKDVKVAGLFDKALQATEVGYDALKKNWRTSVNKIVEANPDKRITLQEPVKKIKDALEGISTDIIPQIKSAVSKNPRLAKALDNPDKAIGLTLKEAQELKNSITSTARPIIRRAQKGTGITPAERGVFDILDSFDDKITEQFPEMMNIRQAYHKGKKAYEMTRPLVESGGAVESSVFSKPQGFWGLGGTPFMKSTQERNAAKEIMGMTKPGESVFETLKNAHRLNVLTDFLGRVGQIGVAGGIATGLGIKAFGRHN